MPMPQKKKKMFVNLSRARTEEQRKLMEEIEADGVCPFCPEHLTKYHPRPIIRKGTYWWVTENMNPYDGTRLHLLLIHYSHITMIDKISIEAFEELKKHFSWAIKKYQLKAGTFLLRFGDTAHTGASVDHLHAHLIERDPKTADSIKVKIG